MKRFSLLIVSVLCVISAVSCSVRTHEVIADHARSGNAILVPLEKPVLCQMGEQWYLQGNLAQVERRHRPCIHKTKNPGRNFHPERYYLVDEDDFEPVYAPMSAEMAERMMKDTYTYTDAISFINSKWMKKLPAGEVQKWQTRAVAPSFFRNMSSHRMIQTEKDSYLLARIGEMTADFSSIYMYPLAGLSAILIDVPGSILIGPPTTKVQKAEAEEVE